MEVRRHDSGQGQSREIHTLTPDEIEAVVKYVDDEYANDSYGRIHPVRLTIRTLLHTGLRAAEFSHMRDDWLVTKDGEPLVTVKPTDCMCSYCQKQARRRVQRRPEDPDEGEDGYDARVEEELGSMWHPKSESGVRSSTVYNDETWRLMREYLGDVGSIDITPNTVWYRVDKVDNDFKEMDGDHDFAGMLTPHRLRHSHATMLQEAGLGIDDIRQQLGHASTQSTQIYMNEPAASRAKRTREQFKESFDL